MGKQEKLLAKMRESQTNVSYQDLYNVCCDHFGLPRQEGSSHAVFKMPWAGDPRVNIQKGRDGNAKSYQVRQVLAAIDKLQEIQAKEDA
ncbi:toxin HicA [Nocardia exalbida]|uniref:toxin HicA n=1 Tax=Nocardia exalbida TaxID=290231 RepID=UPI001C3F227E|nr:toxin HicA [Nocardia exalbida]